jgi:hypothetical protein
LLENEEFLRIEINGIARIYLSPQALGSLGAQVGTGSMLVRAATILFFVEALEAWVVATAPVRTRTTTNARTICFIRRYPQSCILVKRFLWTNQMM